VGDEGSYMFEGQATILSSWYEAGINASDKTRISCVAKRALEEKFHHLRKACLLWRRCVRTLFGAPHGACPRRLPLEGDVNNLRRD